MNLSMYNLKILRMLLEEKSVKSVSEKVFISQSAVSHQLRVMEEYFGMNLFERKGRNIVPTKIGAEVYPYLVRLLDEFERLHIAVQDLKDAKLGEINFAGSINLGTYILPEIVSRFMESYPELRLNLHVYNSKQALKLTALGKLDFCVVPVKLESEHLYYEPICTEDIVLTIAPNKRNEFQVNDIEKLSTVPFICAPKGTEFREIIDAGLKKLGITRQNIVMEVGHPEGTKQAVRAGLGLGMNFRFAVQEELELGLLEEVQIEKLPLTGELYFAFRPHKYLFPSEQKLIDFIREEIANMR